MSKIHLLIALVLSVALGTSFAAEGARRELPQKAKSAAEGHSADRQPAVEEEGSELREAIGESRLIADDNKSAVASETAAAVMSAPESAEAAITVGASKTGSAGGEFVDAAVGGGTVGGEPDVALAGADGGAEAGEPKDVSKLPEKEILIVDAKEKAAKSQSNTVQRVLLSLGVLLVLLTATTLVLKRWSKSSQNRGQNTKIKILTQHHLGPKKSVAILQVAGESLLVGITDHSITMLKTLSLLDEEIPEETPRDFDAAMSDADDDDDEDDIDMAGRRRSRKRGSASGRETDAFAMRGLAEIRDTVTRRLRGTREQ
jgi:flagellar protein FliO/FliZ